MDGQCASLKDRHVSPHTRERTAIILTVVASAHRHDLDVWAYLRDVLERLAKDEDNLEALFRETRRSRGSPRTLGNRLPSRSYAEGVPQDDDVPIDTIDPRSRLVCPDP